MPLQLHAEKSDLLDELLQVLLAHSHLLLHYFFAISFTFIIILHLENAFLYEVIEVIGIFSSRSDGSVVLPEVLVLFEG